MSKIEIKENSNVSHLLKSIFLYNFKFRDEICLKHLNLIN